MAAATKKGEKGFLEEWMNMSQGTPEDIVARMQKEVATGHSASSVQSISTETSNVNKPGIDSAIVSDGPVFDNVVPDEDVEQKGGRKAEQMAMPDSDSATENEVFQIRHY